MKLKPPTDNIVSKLKTCLPLSRTQSLKVKKVSLLIKLGSVFALIFVVLLILAAVFGPKREPAAILPTPIPTLTSREEITQPSVYATDTAILKVESETRELEQELQKVDLKETGLIPPLLDFNIKF